MIVERRITGDLSNLWSTRPYSHFDECHQAVAIRSLYELGQVLNPPEAPNAIQAQILGHQRVRDRDFSRCAVRLRGASATAETKRYDNLLERDHQYRFPQPESTSQPESSTPGVEYDGDRSLQPSFKAIDTDNSNARLLSKLN